MMLTFKLYARTDAAAPDIVSLKPSENGRNIVGQKHPKVVGCYMLRPLGISCCMLLRVLNMGFKLIDARH